MSEDQLGGAEDDPGAEQTAHTEQIPLSELTEPSTQPELTEPYSQPESTEPISQTESTVPTAPTPQTEPTAPFSPTAPTAPTAPFSPTAPTPLTQPTAPFSPTDQIQTEQVRIQLPAQPPVPADRWRAAAVGVLNLSGLGLGYALMRRWVPAAVCWVATGILLLVALPAEAGGVSGALLIIYLLFLVLAAVHGAFRALRTPLTWPRTSRVAAVLAVVMLVVPVGAVALYGQAHANAVQQMLLGRLSQADQLVAATEGESFTSAQPQYDTALATYRDLLDNNRSSRAGQMVPDHLAVFYQTVAGAYTRHDYCGAIAPLTYLRSLTGTVGAADLGSLASWPNDRLATSLYQCGVGSLGTSGNSTATTDFNELLSTFPASAQAAKVEPAVVGAINKAAAGIGGSNPCSVVTTLHTLDTQASGLTEGTASESASLHKDGATAAADVESGTFACGESQYKTGDFTDAQTTMDNFASTYPQDPNKGLAQNFSIAAQIAQQESAAGKVVPTVATGGDIPVTILNDSPDPIQILYTGPVTGTVNIGACSSCSTYPSDAAGQANACTNGNINYPQATINLQSGTTYFLQQNTNDSGASPFASSEQYSDGNAYTDCAYETSILGSL
jgi:hypothetical protein